MGCSGFFLPADDRPAVKQGSTALRELAVWNEYVEGKIDLQEAVRRQKAIVNAQSMPDIVRQKQEQVDRMFESRSRPRSHKKR